MTLDLEIHGEDPAAQLSFEQLLYLLNKRLAAGNIQDAGVVTPLIADLSVTAAKIADAAITNAKIGLAAITSANIQDAAITNAKIADANITTAKINDLQVTTLKVAGEAITTSKHQAPNSQSLTQNIAAGSVAAFSFTIGNNAQIWFTLKNNTNTTLASAYPSSYVAGNTDITVWNQYTSTNSYTVTVYYW